MFWCYFHNSGNTHVFVLLCSFSTPTHTHIPCMISYITSCNQTWLAGKSVIYRL